MLAAATLAGATSCERKLDDLDCPCVSGYVCCAHDDKCHPEGEGCGEDGGAEASAAGGGGLVGAAGEGDAASSGGSLAGQSSGNDSAGGAAGERHESQAGTPNQPAAPISDFPRFCSMSGWCGGKNTFNAAWSSSEDDVWVASNDREVYANNSLSHWNGESWQNYDVARDAWGRVLAIGGSGPDDVWFVGEDSQHARAFHWDGTEFTAMYLEAGELRGVWGSAPDDVWAVGVQGYALHFDGEEWSSELAPSFTHDLDGVWGSASDDVIAVGSNGVVARWNGTQWSLERENQGADLRSVWGSGPDDVWVVGAAATVLHFDGEGWNERDLAVPELAGVEFTAVTGTSETDVWIAERGGRLVHYDGAEFRVLPISSKGVEALATAGEGDVWAFGEQAFSARCQPERCVEGTSVTQDDLFAVWGRAADDVWAVGANGVIARFDGESWQRVQSPTTADLRAIHGAPSGPIWAVGDAVIRYDGGEWTLESETEAAPLHAVFALSAEDVWVAGDGATLRHFDGESWVDFDALGATETLTSLWGSAGDDVWAVGIGDVNLHYDGAEWAKVNSPLRIDFAYQVLSGTSRDNVFIHGWYHDGSDPSFGEGRFDGQEWDFDGGAYGSALTTFGKPASWATGPREVWVLCGANTGFSEIYRLGSTIQGDSAGTDVALYGVWGVSDEEIWVVGAGGTVLEKEFSLPL
jgi:hypothetical protein